MYDCDRDLRACMCLRIFLCDCVCVSVCVIVCECVPMCVAKVCAVLASFCL